MKSVSVIRWLLVPLFLTAVFPVFAKPPQAVTECETIITEPGKYRLANDLLNCEEFGVNIHASDVTLDLKGHTISCADNDVRTGGVLTGLTPDPEVFVPVYGVKITNGTVTGCTDGVVLAVAEDSKVTKMTSWGNHYFYWYNPDEEEYVALSGTGITVWMSRNNVIMHNHTFDNESRGIGSWASSGNLFKHNTSNNNGGGWEGYGISLDEETNSQVTCNRIYGNVDGLYLGVGSNDNLLRGNLIVENSFSGIGMMGLAWDGFFWMDIPGGNLVRSNIVDGNGGVDLFEFYFDLVNYDLLLHPDGTCMNTWVKNQFGPSVYGPDGCFGTPVVLKGKDVCALDYDD